MDFGEQVKELRKKESLTQEQFAQKLNVTRQAVSNWENNRNLPDIEMLIKFSNVFKVSLDQLILGGTNMNNMTEKLIKDGSETRRAKINLATAVVGAVLMLMGFMCFVIKSVSVEYIDELGILHENFFLLPVGFLFLFGGVLVLFLAGASYLKVKKRRINDEK